VTTGTDVANDVAVNDAPADVVVDAGPACNPNAPFGTPTVLTTLSLLPADSGAGNSRGGHLSIDYKTAYFQYSTYLYSATRPTPSGDTFGAPTVLSSLNYALDAAVSNASPSVSSDGLTIYFSSNRTGINQIYVSTRATVTDVWGAPSIVAGLPAIDTTSPFLQGDGSTLYFTAGSTIYRALITNKVVGAPTVVSELNLDGGPTNGPFGVTADGLTAYFSRVLSADGGPAQHFKMWKATRTNISSPFANIVAAPELNGPDTVNDDFTWVSNDGCQLILSSFRSGGSNLFIAIKP
jgi:hypothetical protein